jgi:hypothetical protein
MTKGIRRAAVATCAVVAGLAAQSAVAAPPQSFEQEGVDRLDAANSVETVRQLAVDIGPRRSATPEERRAAEHLAGILESYGFTTSVQSVPFTGTRNTAKVTSPNATLPNGPHWQMSSSLSGKITGDDAPVEAAVVYAGTGASATDFPADTAGKIVLMDQGANTAARTTQVANAVAAGAVAVILGNTAANSAPTTTITLTTPQPATPVLGGGRAHLDWIKGLLAAGPLTLKLVTNSYVNHPRTNVIGIRHAIGDPTGSTAPIVSIGAHIDSVLGAPGAHDDASGNGATMEIARILSSIPLDKEIRVGGFGGEEDGLVGARAYVNTLTAAERSRYIGHWQMDMVGTPYGPAEFWGLVPDGTRNFVIEEAYGAAARAGFTGMKNCFLGQSDHQAFFDVGISSALFIWLNYRFPAPPRTCTSGPFTPDYTTEPEYHRPTDGMNNVSQERLQTTLDVVGGAVLRNAMNKVTFTVTSGSGQPLAGAKVSGDCGDGARNLGESGTDGIAVVAVPHGTCDFTVTSAGAAAPVDDVPVAGDQAIPVSLTGADTGVTGTVPATLSLALGAPASFGAFTPGVARAYLASTTASVITTGGDASLSVADNDPAAPGHLVNGTYVLPQAVAAKASSAAATGGDYAAVSGTPTTLLTYPGPASNDPVTIGFRQAIGANDPLRTGAYSKTLTFTLSTTTP